MPRKKDRSIPSSQFLFVRCLDVDRWLEAAQFGEHAAQVLGVANEQETIGDEMTVKVCDHSALGSGVKIDQDIAAEDGVEWTFDKTTILIQIQPSEVDHLLDLGLHFHLA